MPKLAVNVFARSIGYGPGYGDTVPPADLWHEFGPEVWEVAPEVTYDRDEAEGITVEEMEERLGVPAVTDAEQGDDEYARTLAIAEGLGIEIDPRWRVPGLRKAIARHHAGAQP
jgi:hypothetical protein